MLSSLKKDNRSWLSKRSSLQSWTYSFHLLTQVVPNLTSLVQDLSAFYILWEQLRHFSFTKSSLNQTVLITDLGFSVRVIPQPLNNCFYRLSFIHTKDYTRWTLFRANLIKSQIIIINIWKLNCTVIVKS